MGWLHFLEENCPIYLSLKYNIWIPVVALQFLVFLLINGHFYNISILFFPFPNRLQITSFLLYTLKSNISLLFPGKLLTVESSAINKRNKELLHLSKELSLSVNFLSAQLSAFDFYIFTESITSYNKKSLQKSLYTQQKKLFSLTRDCNLPIFTANETISNLTQYELSQEETDLLKAALYFSIQPDKIRKLEIFTTFEMVHRYETLERIKVLL